MEGVDKRIKEITKFIIQGTSACIVGRECSKFIAESGYSKGIERGSLQRVL